MTNAEIATVFRDLAYLLELKKESWFKIRAYRNAASILEQLPKEAASMIASGEDLKKVSGIGKAIASKTAELVTTGKLDYYEKLKEGRAGINDS